MQTYVYVCRQQTEFLDANNTIPSTQSAHRKFHSTESALYSDIHMTIDRGHVMFLGLFYFSTAFDMVDHSILLERHKRSFGIVDSPLGWIKSYLENRFQAVVMNQAKSPLQHLTCGVPQGSVLGSLPFVLYIRDVTAIIWRHGLLNYCYADDT